MSSQRVAVSTMKQLRVRVFWGIKIFPKFLLNFVTRIWYWIYNKVREHWKPLKLKEEEHSAKTIMVFENRIIRPSSFFFRALLPCLSQIFPIRTRQSRKEYFLIFRQQLKRTISSNRTRTNSVKRKAILYKYYDNCENIKILTIFQMTSYRKGEFYLMIRIRMFYIRTTASSIWHDKNSHSQASNSEERETDKKKNRLEQIHYKSMKIFKKDR